MDSREPAAAAAPEVVGGEQKRPPGGILFRYRNALGIALGAVLVFFWNAGAPLWQQALGAGLILAGASLRIWSILQIGGSARKTSRLKAAKLVSWGPYSMVRNPLYIANMTVFSGFILLAGLYFALPFMLAALWIWYHVLVRREEEFLRGIFAQDFRDYCSSVRRWLPGARYRRRPAELPPYPFLRALRRERGHLIIVGGGLAAALVFHLLGGGVVEHVGRRLFSNP